MKRRYQRVIILLLILSTICCTTIYATEKTDDIAIIKETKDVRYLTRAEAVIMIGMVFQSKESVMKQQYRDMPFTDVDMSTIEGRYIAYLMECNAITGTSLTTFSPDATITREEIATIIGRILVNQCGLTISEGATSAGHFADAGIVRIYAKPYVELLRRLRLFKGDVYNRINPKKKVTVEEGMLFSSRLFVYLYSAPFTSALK